MLYHCFSVDVLAPEKREKTGSAGYDPEEWKRTYSATPEGQLYLNPSYIFGCLRDGAKHTKKGRGSIMQDVAATLQVCDERVLLNRHAPDDLTQVTRDSSQPVYVDVRAVTNPGTKGRNARFRLALSSGWEADFSIMWESSLVGRQTMEGICVDAGNLVGVADGRKLGFGRFEVISFEVVDVKATTT